MSATHARERGEEGGAERVSQLVDRLRVYTPRSDTLKVSSLQSPPGDLLGNFCCTASFSGTPRVQTNKQLESIDGTHQTAYQREARRLSPP